MSKLKIRKDDKIIVLAGKDKGKKGKVLRTLPKEGRVVVESVAMIKRHTRPTRTSPQGGIVEKEDTIHVSNVQLVCPNCGQSTRVGHRETEEGNRVRVCKKCGVDIRKS